MGQLRIRFKGKIDGAELKPNTIDIQYLINKLGEVQDFLTGSIKSHERPKIITTIEDGSLVCNSSLNGFADIKDYIVDINTLASIDPEIDFLEPRRKKTIYKWQKEAKEENLEITISDSDLNLDFIISPETNYSEPVEFFTKSQVYVVGEIKDMGGKERINIHIDTRNHGYLKIGCTKEQVNAYKQFLYQKIGAYIRVKQNLDTGEIKNGSAKLLKIDPPRNKNVIEATEKFINSSKGVWADVEDPTSWVRGLRDEEYPINTN